MNHRSSRAIGAISLLGAVASACPARAQDVDAATTLFNAGLAQMEAGRFAAGCPALAESQRLDPRAGRLFTLAQCEVRWGRLATAVARLNEYLELYERLPPDQKVRQEERKKLAREQLDKLSPDVPLLTLSLPPGAPAGTVVKRDGEVVAGAALGLGLPVDPGDHLLSTQAPGGPLREQQITISRGEKKPLTLDVRAAPSVDPAPRAPVAVATPPDEAAAASDGTASPDGRRVAVYAVGGLGISGLALGGVMGGLALGKKGIIEAHCASASAASGPIPCDPTGLAAASSGKTLGVVSTASVAAGLGAIGIAVALLLTEHRPTRPTTSARGPWIAPDVLSIGPGGATVGAVGHF